jgi:hypothetical protein
MVEGSRIERGGRCAAAGAGDLINPVNRSHLRYPSDLSDDGNWSNR